jgi:hypothetical protein
MREQPVKIFMLCCDESARMPYCKEGSDNTLLASQPNAARKTTNRFALSRQGSNMSAAPSGGRLDVRQARALGELANVG